VRAIRVPVEGDPEPIDFHDDQPSVWADLIGAAHGVDFITLRESGLQVVVDDHSLVADKPLNPRVTWFAKGSGRWLSEVHGDVLIVGVDPDSGETTDIHEVLYEALLLSG
jgi:hypothetical protein